MWCKAVVLSGMLLAAGAPGFAQAPPPGPSERELQAPLVLDDGKPTPGRTPDAPPSGWRALGSMLLVLGLAGGGLYAFKRWGAKRLPGSGGGRLNLEETLALGERRFVAILRADGEKFLIAMGPQGTSLISRLDAGETGGPGEFAEALESQVEMTAPMPVREMEAMIRREQRP